MKIDFYTRLSVQIIFIFCTVIFVSFIPDSLHGFFGDFHCKGAEYISSHLDDNKQMVYGKYIGCRFISVEHDPEWHWGYRHWIWFFMGLFLFAVQVARVVKFIEK